MFAMLIEFVSLRGYKLQFFVSLVIGRLLWFLNHALTHHIFLHTSGEFGDRALQSLGNLAVNLRELYFSDAKRVEDGGLTAIAKGECQLKMFADS